MKTRELRDYLRNSHHSFREDGKYIRVYGDGSCLCLGKVGLEKLYDVKIFEPDLISEGLYRRLTGYAQTLPEDREEEKRYWLKLKTTLPVSEKFRYLVLYKPEGEYIILNKGEGESHKSIFTESEIAQMDITGFEKIEVPE